MAKYQVVEVTHIDSGLISDGGLELDGVLSEFCSVGWELVSTRLLADNGVHRALLLLKR